MDRKTVRRFRNDLFTWADENLREYPWRDTDATFYEVFVAEFFLTQTPADNVGRLFPEFVERYPSLAAIKEADEETLAAAIEPIGFYNMRAASLKQIAEEYDSLPRDPDKLMELPRVGPYVANATVCFACGEPLPVLDRNVERIYGRVFGEWWPDTLSAQEALARNLVPEDGARTYNLALLDFGAAVCTADPQCEICFAPDYCTYYADIRL